MRLDLLLNSYSAVSVIPFAWCRCQLTRNNLDAVRKTRTALFVRVLFATSSSLDEPNSTAVLSMAYPGPTFDLPASRRTSSTDRSIKPVRPAAPSERCATWEHHSLPAPRSSCTKPAWRRELHPSGMEERPVDNEPCPQTFQRLVVVDPSSPLPRREPDLDGPTTPHG